MDQIIGSHCGNEVAIGILEATDGGNIFGHVAVDESNRAHDVAKTNA